VDADRDAEDAADAEGTEHAPLLTANRPGVEVKSAGACRLAGREPRGRERPPVNSRDPPRTIRA
jgi:hypothetical protein